MCIQSCIYRSKLIICSCRIQISPLPIAFVVYAQQILSYLAFFFFYLFSGTNLDSEEKLKLQKGVGFLFLCLFYF